MKYSRLLVGIIVLSSLLLFMGTKSEADECFDFCSNIALEAKWGWVEVWNDTLFHIGVGFAWDKGSETYEIKHDPGMIRSTFGLGSVTVITFIIDPITRKWKFHKLYTVSIKNPGDTAIIRVKGGSLL